MIPESRKVVGNPSLPSELIWRQSEGENWEPIWDIQLNIVTVTTRAESAENKNEEHENIESQEHCDLETKPAEI